MSRVNFQSKGWKGFAASQEWADLFKNLDRWLIENPGEMVVHYDSRDVRKVVTPLGTVYVKEIRALTDAGLHHRDLFSWFKWIFRGSRAIDTWHASRQLLRKGFLCPMPILAVRKRFGITPKDIFISAEIPYANLWDHMPKGMDVQKLVNLLANAIVKLHQAGFAHGDCILRNLCYDEIGHKIAFMDNDRTWMPPLPVRQMQQQRNLAQMAYSILKRFGESSSMAFLTTYAQKAGWPNNSTIKSIQNAAIKRRNRKHIH